MTEEDYKFRKGQRVKLVSRSKWLLRHILEENDSFSGYVARRSMMMEGGQTTFIIADRIPGFRELHYRLISCFDDRTFWFREIEIEKPKKIKVYK